MKSIVTFTHVSKSYRLKAGQPRSFRELFVARRPGNGAGAATVKSGLLWALRDASFEIQPGQTVGLIGPNGAGKSTALKLIGRILPPTSGRVEVRGRVAALLELGAGFHPDLTGRENVFLSGALAGISREAMQRKFPAIVDFSEIEAFIDMPVKHYSSGMFARLAFAVSIHLDPEILLVDEVLAVGDYAFQRKCLERIAGLQREGVTICLVTHSLDTVRAMCTRAIWFDHGQIQADGAAEAVVRHYMDQAFAREATHLAEAVGPTEEHRWGSRRIEVVRVRLTNAQGVEQTIFQTGEPLVVQLNYRTREPVVSPIFGIAIYRQDGLHICGPNTAFSGLVLPTMEGEGQVLYTIPYLPFLEGLYQITAAVVNQDDTEIYDYHDRAYPFRVLNRNGSVKEQFGLITVKGDWKCEPALLSPMADRSRVLP